MKKKYNVIIVGAGSAGIFCAYRMITTNPSIRILLIEKGEAVEKRTCPSEIAGGCIHCKVCSITHGFAGAGAASDCKLSTYNEGDVTFVGGELEKFVAVDKVRSLMDQVIEVYVKYGAKRELVGGETHPAAQEIREKAEKVILQFVSVPFLHTGTSGGRQIFYRIQQFLVDSGVEILFNTEVQQFMTKKGRVIGISAVRSGKRLVAYADKVVLATGRAGAASWNKRMCETYGIHAYMGPIKIGVRYETHNQTMAKVNQLYEGKFKMPKSRTHDAGLTFCHNPGGSVVSESYGDITLANGHSDVEKTSNTNLALLFKMDFGPNAIAVAENLARTINLSANGQVMVQRLGDFQKNRATTEELLAKNLVRPTLTTAVPGNLQIGMPGKLVKNINYFVNIIDKVVPGFASTNNLLYGLEVKFSNYIIELDNHFQTSLPGLYAIGDGAGLTNGLIQAAASGLLLGEYLLEEMK